MELIYDFAVEGYGPAALGFTYKLAEMKSEASIVIFELGTGIEERKHDDPTGCVCGIGGAGIFSDGKFSAHPAGTAVWNLPGIEDQIPTLIEMIGKDETGQHRFTKDNFDISSSRTMSPNSDHWSLKKYKSINIYLPDRCDMVAGWQKYSKSSLKNLEVHTSHMVIDWKKNDDGLYELTAHDLEMGKYVIVKARNLIMSGGRFSPLNSPSIKSHDVQRIFRRIEFGVRVETDADIFDKIKSLDRGTSLDPKYMKNAKYRNFDLQFRTFCVSRDGETVHTKIPIYRNRNIEYLQTFSGRSDVLPTKKTNFGCNIRILRQTKDSDDIFQDLFKAAIRTKFEINLKDILANGFTEKVVSNSFEEYYGLEVASMLSIALNDLFEQFPELKNESTKFYGPTIEGVGLYPHIDPLTLKVNQENIYCIGDSGGIFRGLVQAIASGIWLANQIG